MNLHRLTLPPQQLSSVPTSERALLVVLAHALNEVNVLNKLLLLCSSFDPEPKWNGHAHACQALVLARALTGKLNEAWQAVQKGYFGTKLSQLHDSRLEGDAAEGLARLKGYFGRKNVVNTIRNHFAFHYSLDHASALLPTDVPAEELCIYLGKTNGNSLYQFAEFAMNKALMDAINPSDAQAAFDQMLSETSSVVRWFNDFAQGVLFAILDMHLDAAMLHEALEPLDIGPVPSSTSISIPFFFEVPTDLLSPDHDA